MASEKISTTTPATPMWEKTVGLMGLLVLCAGLIYLIWAASAEKQSPPQITFTIQEIKRLDNSYLVKVKVANIGHESVAALQIEGSLEQADNTPETNSAEIDYVPSQSHRYVGLFFQSEPRPEQLTFRAMSYQEP